MITLNVSEAAKTLQAIIAGAIKTSVMMWGAPGIGKSSIVQQVAEQNGMEVIDVRLSQLAPTDIRGLPFVQEGIAHFAPPSFLPQSGKGILFLDEVNLAPPAIQNVAMQLVLDRRVGDYTVPDGWFIVAAGNRVEDRAAVNQMPAPLANRFLHFTVEHDLNSWKTYAIKHGIREEIISYLNFRPDSLHKFSKDAIAWPSPRSWGYASDLLKIGLSVDPAVGEGAAAEFKSFIKIYSKLPAVEKVLNGDMSVKMPNEPSMVYAVTGALVARSETVDNYFNAAKWLVGATTEDYLGVFFYDAITALSVKGMFENFAVKVNKDKDLQSFMARYAKLLNS
jgi:hypothetical protein